MRWMMLGVLVMSSVLPVWGQHREVTVTIRADDVAVLDATAGEGKAAELVQGWIRQYVEQRVSSQASQYADTHRRDRLKAYLDATPEQRRELERAAPGGR